MASVNVRLSRRAAPEDRVGRLVVLVVSEPRVDEYLGVSYLAASLRSEGYDCEIMQWMLPTHRDRLGRLLTRGNRTPLLIGVTWLYDSSQTHACEVTAFVKRHAPSATVVVGGHPPSLDPTRALASSADIDCVIRGEGDHTIVAVADAVWGGDDLGSIDGLALRQGGAIQLTAPPAQLDDLDALPMAARDTLDQVIGHLGQGDAVIARMCTSRGCYARCEFCSMVSFYSLDGKGMRWRSRSPECVAAEIAEVNARFGVNRFWFVDDEFLGPPRDHGQRALAIGRAIVDAGLDVEWGFDTRANGVEAVGVDGILKLKRAGLRVVAMGIESASGLALRRFRKGLEPSTNWAAIRVLRAAGVDFRFGFIMYDPQVTVPEILENLHFLRWAGAHRICNTGPFRLLNAEFPEVGTPFAARLGIATTADEAISATTKPKLTEVGLGYIFEDRAVRRLRDLLYRFTSEVAESAMVPRPEGEPELQADVWWQGTNFHPTNIAAMEALLDVHEWTATHIDHLADDNLPSEALDLFRSGLERYAVSLS